MPKLLSNCVLRSHNKSVKAPHYKLSFEIEPRDNQALGGNNEFEGGISNKSPTLLSTNRWKDWNTLRGCRRQAVHSCNILSGCSINDFVTPTRKLEHSFCKWGNKCLQHQSKGIHKSGSLFCLLARFYIACYSTWNQPWSKVMGKRDKKKENLVINHISFR